MLPRKSSALLLCLLAASSAWAEPPKLSITGPSTVIPGSAVFLRCDTDAVAIKWVVCPASAKGNLIGLTLYQGMSPDGKVILAHAAFFSSPTPGTYTFTVIGTKNDELGEATHTLINGTPGPDPGPDPPPPPPPGDRFVLVVAESKTRTAEQAVTINGLTAWLSGAKHSWKVADPDAKDSSTGKTPTWLATYLAKIQAAKVPLPALLVASPSDAGNEVLAVVPLPATADAAIAEVKKWGG